MDVHLNGHKVAGFALGEAPGDFAQAISTLLANMRAFSETLSPREELILRLGLAASHLEESAASGHWKRAEAHAETVVKLAKKLEETPT